MQSTSSIANKQELLEDEKPVLLYQDGQILHVTVGQLAAQALNNR
jgi:hypothetical protein